MGRPINKKYFGNLTSPYDDAQTGGPTGQGSEGVASVVVTTTSTGYTTLPGVTFSAPELDGGVTALGTATSLKAVSATVATGGTGGAEAYYVPGQILTVAGGTFSSQATFTVAEVEVRTLSYDQTSGTGTNYEVNDQVTISGAGWATPWTATVTAITGTGAISMLSWTNKGVYTGTSVTQPFTITTTTNTGTGGSVEIAFGVKTVTIANGGVYTAVASNPRTTSVNTGTGAGATLNVAYGVNAVGVTTAGSGYQAAPSVTFSAGSAAASSVLTSTTANALKVTAFIPAADGGTQALAADIMKQEASRRYLVRTSEGQGACILTAAADVALTAGQMNLIATDSVGSTYYVTKLTARRARLTQAVDGGSGFEYATGAVAGWSLDPATTGVVSLANA